jgi:hypothetical protein
VTDFEDIVVRLSAFAETASGALVFCSCGDYTNFNAGHDVVTNMMFWLALIVVERHISMDSAVREMRAQHIEFLAAATGRKVLVVPACDRSTVEEEIEDAIRKGVVTREHVDKRVKADPKTGDLLVWIEETLFSAKDDTMLRNMYAHRSYMANNDAFMQALLRCKPVKAWIKGDDSFRSWDVPTADKLTLMVDSAMNSEMSLQKCLAGYGGEAERIVTDGVSCRYPLRRTIGNLLYRSPQTGNRIKRQDMRSMFRAHIAKLLRCGSRTGATMRLWQAFIKRMILEHMTPALRAAAHVPRSEDGLGWWPVDRTITSKSTQTRSAVKSIGEYAARLPRHMSRSYRDWCMRPGSRMRAVLGPDAKRLTIVEKWEDRMHEANIESIWPVFISKEYEDAQTVTPDAVQVCRDIWDEPTIMAHLPRLGDRVQWDLDDLYSVVLSRAKMSDVGWNPVDAAGVCLGSCVIPEGDLLEELGRKMGMRGFRYRVVTTAAGELGAKGCDWAGQADAVMNTHACNMCLRGRDLFDEVALPDFPAELVGVLHSKALRAAWLIASDWVAEGVSKRAVGTRPLRSMKTRISWRDFASLAREYMSMALVIFWADDKWKRFGRH